MGGLRPGRPSIDPRSNGGAGPNEVDELVIVDPTKRSIAWPPLAENRYVQVRSSALLGVSVDEVTRNIAWPGNA